LKRSRPTTASSKPSPNKPRSIADAVYQQAAATGTDCVAALKRGGYSIEFHAELRGVYDALPIPARLVACAMLRTGSTFKSACNKAGVGEYDADNIKKRVTNFVNLVLYMEFNDAIMTRDEALLRLSDIARASLNDVMDYKLSLIHI
jgi:hypothetical protein